MLATPENQIPQTPSAFPSDQSSEPVQPQSAGPFSNQTPEEGNSNDPLLPSASADIPTHVSQTGKRPSARPIIAVLLLIVVLVGSSLFFFAKSGRSVLPSNSHPTVTPGVGVPVVRGNWEVTLRRVHQESLLNGMNTGLGTNTYTPISGYTFLVLDIKLRDLRSNQQVMISPSIFALISSDGRTSPPDLVSNEAMQGYSPGVVSMFTSGNEMELSLAFAIPQQSHGQVFKLDFQGVPLISFTAK
jgi:hypothetical protein